MDYEVSLPWVPMKRKRNDLMQQCESNNERPNPYLRTANYPPLYRQFHAFSPSTLSLSSFEPKAPLILSTLSRRAPDLDSRINGIQIVNPTLKKIVLAGRKFHNLKSLTLVIDPRKRATLASLFNEEAVFAECRSEVASWMKEINEAMWAASIAFPNIVSLYLFLNIGRSTVRVAAYIPSLARRALCSDAILSMWRDLQNLHMQSDSGILEHGVRLDKSDRLQILSLGDNSSGFALDYLNLRSLRVLIVNTNLLVHGSWELENCPRR